MLHFLHRVSKISADVGGVDMGNNGVWDDSHSERTWEKFTGLGEESIVKPCVQAAWVYLSVFLL